MTPTEQILWKQLRGRKLAEFKFRRQHPLAPFYLDFACVEARVVVELDGESHLGQDARDIARDLYLDQNGWLVLRFWNTQVYEEIDAVLEMIYQTCVTRIQYKTPSPPTPLPRSTGGEGSRS